MRDQVVMRGALGVLPTAFVHSAGWAWEGREAGLYLSRCKQGEEWAMEGPSPGDSNPFVPRSPMASGGASGPLLSKIVLNP